jgi:undecaprenyl-diphosphatase
MNLLEIAVLALVQGAAELLPVSSSAHVIAAEKLMGLDPTAPAMTLLLVMLHTGTMFAVILYFWRSWRERYFGSPQRFKHMLARITAATVATAVVGLVLKAFIERELAARHGTPTDIEAIFGDMRLIATALAAAGCLILWSSRRASQPAADDRFTLRTAAVVGAVQGLCLPFRGFSRSGATISSAMLMGLDKARAEEFSFALAVVLTPPVVAREIHRAWQAHSQLADGVAGLIWPSLVGMGLSFLAGLGALRWLSRWLEAGRWHYFGIYCLMAAAAVLAVG